MKRYKDFLIVGIDHGYGNIKTANTVTPSCQLYMKRYCIRFYI